MKKKQTRKIGIVGANIEPDELKEKGSDYELWGCNNLYRKFRDVQFARWFELHTIEFKKFFENRNNVFLRRGRPFEYEYLKELNALDIPVYMQRKWKRIKKSIEFPRDKVARVTKNPDYYGCTFAFQVGLAILEKVNEIAFFGVGLVSQEYYYQRPSTEFMIGLAAGKGIGIVIDETSQLLYSNYIYAYEENFDHIYMLHGRAAGDLSHTILTTIQQGLDDYYYKTILPALREEE